MKISTTAAQLRPDGPRFRAPITLAHAHTFRTFGVALGLLALSGCTTYGMVENTPVAPTGVTSSYSLKARGHMRPAGDVLLILAFSGGGTRAAALSYGVLQELRDTSLKGVRLLDEVDTISSVSGGSFTAAYYGLNGDGIFDDFEQVFLKRDVESALLHSLFNPFNWLSSTGRTDRSVAYYDETIFKGATFADMVGVDRPLVVINASDLGNGVRFSFVQEYFNLLCSDLSTFPVARAVTASSAVPVVFQPVIVENFDGCRDDDPEWLVQARKRAPGHPELSLMVRGVDNYADKARHKYVHFVDGGITDNLGLRAVYNITELAGGAKATVETFREGKVPRRIALISVDASTEAAKPMDLTNAEPSIEATIGAMSDVQLHRYNVDTDLLMVGSLARWRDELATPTQPVDTYFVRLDLKQTPDPEARKFLNAVPTSFDLSDEQVDRLIAAGRQLLRDNPEFRRLLTDLDKP